MARRCRVVVGVGQHDHTHNHRATRTTRCVQCVVADTKPTVWLVECASIDECKYLSEQVAFLLKSMFVAMSDLTFFVLTLW